MPDTRPMRVGDRTWYDELTDDSGGYDASAGTRYDDYDERGTGRRYDDHSDYVDDDENPPSGGLSLLYVIILLAAQILGWVLFFESPSTYQWVVLLLIVGVIATMVLPIAALARQRWLINTAFWGGLVMTSLAVGLMLFIGPGPTDPATATEHPFVPRVPTVPSTTAPSLMEPNEIDIPELPSVDPTMLVDQPQLSTAPNATEDIEAEAPATTSTSPSRTTVNAPAPQPPVSRQPVPQPQPEPEPQPAPFQDSPQSEPAQPEPRPVPQPEPDPQPAPEPEAPQPQDDPTVDPGGFNGGFVDQPG